MTNTLHAATPQEEYQARWRAALAPKTGDIRTELTREAADYLGLTVEEAQRRLEQSSEDFPQEWNRMVTNPSDVTQLTRFYNESQAELFEQIAWHSTELIHHRSLVCADLVSTLPGREFLDYGSGIGSNALVFGLAGFTITLADIADPLRNFAKWRCERRGLRVHAIDLKHETLPSERYDVITCFDVLEHIPDAVGAVRRMRDALRPGGILFLYAPFGFDPERPMHVVHEDRVSSRMRSMGFDIVHEWENGFPEYLWAPRVYRRVARSSLANSAYFVRDTWLNGPVTDSLISRVRTLTGTKRALRAT